MSHPPPMRPRFEAHTPRHYDDVHADLKALLTGPERALDGAVLDGHAELKIPPKRHHFWSPQLNIEIKDAQDGGCDIHGLFSPRADVWTLFMALYALTTFGGLTGLMFGWSQWTLGRSPYALLGVLVACVVAGGIYAASLAGQRLGHDQMRELHDALQSVLQPDHTPE